MDSSAEMPPTNPDPIPGHEVAVSDAPDPGPGRRSGVGTIIAWVVVIAACVLIGSRNAGGPVLAQSEGESDSPLMERIFEIQTKLFVGAVEAQRTDPDADDPGDDMAAAFVQMKPFNTGSIRQRQRFAVVAFELAGIEEARATLDEIDTRLAEVRTAAGDADPEVAARVETDAEVQRRLRTLYGATGGDRAAPAIDTLDDIDRAVLTDELGWIGELALVPPVDGGSAARAALTEPLIVMANIVAVAVVVGLSIGVLGFVGLVLWAIFAFSGRLKSGLPRRSAHSGVYAETFAIWLVGFFVLQIGLTSAAALVAPNSVLLAGFLGFFASLAALAWPGVRGVSWSEVREDIGLTTGRRGALEPFIGVACYAMNLPIIAVGVGIMLLIMLVVGKLAGGDGALGPENTPAHPIVMEIVSGSWWPRIQILLVACVAAPIVEEIAFRGLLYRHLRDSTRWAGAILSIVLSTLFSAFVFAVIHPQGLLAVPALMAVAVGMTLAREWRGTLIPSMVVHAVSNGIVMTMAMLILGS